MIRFRIEMSHHPGATRRYICLPADSVSLCAEGLGIQASQEVTSAIVEDASFRIRQLTDVATQFMKHAKRRRLTTDDVNKALKWSSVEPLYDHGTTDPPVFQSIHESGLYSLQDHEVKLADVALSSPLERYPLPSSPTVNAVWLAVEGVDIGKESQGDSARAITVDLKTTTSEPREKYLTLLLEAVTGENEDLRRIALTDVQSNASIANILPELVKYLQETLSCWLQFTPTQLVRVLKLAVALFRNDQLFLDPYAPSIFAPLKSIILNPSYLHTGHAFDHWSVRQLVAICLAEIIRRCSSPLNDYVPDIHSSFRQLLAFQSELPLAELYGIVVTICHMGGKSIAEVLLPQLEQVTGYVQSFLESSAPVDQENALRVYETLLLSAEILLTSDSTLQFNPIVPPAPKAASSSSPTSTGQPILTNPDQFNSQLPRMSSDSLFGAPASSMPPSDPSSLIPPMDVDGGDITTAMMGNGVDQATTKSASLYDYLFGIFGERLSLRLTGHRKFIPERQGLPQSNSSTKSTAGPTASTGDDETRKPPPAPPSDANLLIFLGREGFKATRIDTHRKVLPRLPMYRDHGINFCLPRMVLPMQRNVLEERQSRKQRRIKAGARTGPSQSNTSSVAAQFKGRSRTGSRHGRSRPTASIDVCISDISSSWL